MSEVEKTQAQINDEALQNSEVNIKMNVANTEKMLNALGELPYLKAVSFIDDIMKQVVPQVAEIKKTLDVPVDKAEVTSKRKLKTVK